MERTNIWYAILDHGYSGYENYYSDGKWNLFDACEELKRRIDKDESIAENGEIAVINNYDGDEYCLDVIDADEAVVYMEDFPKFDKYLYSDETLLCYYEHSEGYTKEEAAVEIMNRAKTPVLDVAITELVLKARRKNGIPADYSDLPKERKALKLSCPWLFSDKELLCYYIGHEGQAKEEAAIEILNRVPDKGLDGAIIELVHKAGRENKVSVDKTMKNYKVEMEIN